MLTLKYFVSLTSESIGDIIINSVAIAFIMDIDNFCVDAFQTEAGSERGYNTEFETAWEQPIEKFSEGELRPLDPDVVKTFSNWPKVLGVIVGAALVVTWIRLAFCGAKGDAVHS